MELVDQRFFCSAFACGSIGGGMDTAGFAVIFLPSSGSQAIFLDVGAATFLATQHMHYPYRTETPSAVHIIPLPRQAQYIVSTRIEQAQRSYCLIHRMAYAISLAALGPRARVPA